MEEHKSKSQKKRDAEALQKFGVKLIDLNVSDLERLPLPAPLRQAIMDAKTIKGHGGVRRQSQLIGKLMRASDSDAIIAAYEELLADSRSQTALFHEIEHWRDRLINGDKDALTEFVNQYQPQDVQQLRQLVKKVAEDQQNNRNTGASTALFRFLRSCL
ncbi:ribosome biogenesis factor YjgA [Legionella spiritensis]|uniref:Alpha helix protein n=1 Tax=Legionella spiritensis TaxID=452 RepID=A0A0W0YWI9_LEGSP|nr:ribosome biogenesis factor YjgA [Legionella spiritensis]KTD61258.1 alpha helix protein [Legionella spiritensis]SNV23555.1 alpha helix protein [Legionella spiritensis]